MLNLTTKLPGSTTTIFATMSALAREQGALNLGQGFPGFPIDPVLGELVGRAIREGHNQYAPMQGMPELREIISDKMAGLYGKRYDAQSEITITAGGTQAIFTAITALVHPGDEVIMFAPAYDCYAPAVEICGGITKWVNLQYPGYHINWNEVREMVSRKTKLIIINSPHNPSGTCLQTTDLEELESIVGGTDIIVLSDEVYEHIIFDGQRHESLARYPTLANQSVIVYSFGKTFHCTGWKMGYAVAPRELTIEFRKVHQFNVFSCSTPVQKAFCDYMINDTKWKELSAFYQDKRNKLVNLLQNSRFGIRPSAGTYFQLLDYSGISDERDIDFAIRLTKEFKVASIPCSVFYPDPNATTDRVIRLCFAKDDEMLERAAEILNTI